MDLGKNNMKGKNEKPNNVVGFEGFDTIAPNDPLSTLNATQQQQMQQSNTTFNQNLSTYSNDRSILRTDTQNYIDAQSNKNPYRNKNIRLSNGGIYYVTNSGLAKQYPSMEVYNSTLNQNGCPGSFIQLDASVKRVGNIITTTPQLRVGSFVKKFNTCGIEGKNIQVVKPDEPPEPTYNGCYNLTPSSQLLLQEDMGKNVNLEACKIRAYDKGSSLFALDSTNGNSQCYIGTAGAAQALKSGGEAIRTVTSWEVEVPGFKHAFFNESGEFGLYYFDETTSTYQTKIIAKAFPDSANCGAYGGKISIVDATWGSGCNTRNTMWNGQPASYNVPANNLYNQASFAAQGKKSVDYRVNDHSSYGRLNDPAWGCPKDFRAKYKCGSGPTKEIYLPGEAGGKIASFDCVNEANACSGAVLSMQDDGNLVIYTSKGAVWSTGTYGKFGVRDPSKINSFNKSHLNQWDIMTPGMILLSNTGKAYLECTPSGIKINYAISQCKAHANYTFREPQADKYTKGLAFKVYKGYFNDNISFFDSAQITNISSTNVMSSLLTASSGQYTHGAWYGQFSILWEGYFLATASGNWKFGIVADDAAYVWIGSDALKANRKRENAIAKVPGTHGPVDSGLSTVSLEAGKYYPIAIAFGNWGYSAFFKFTFVKPDGTTLSNGNGHFFTKLPDDRPGVAAYTNATTDLSGLGKVGYVTDDGKIKTYPTSLLSPSTNYYEVGTFNSGGTVLKTIDTTDVNRCKTGCNAEPGCDGFVFLNGNTCQLKTADQIYPKQNRIKVPNGAKLFKRGYDVKNNESCSKTVISTTTNNWNNYEKSNNMDMNQKCNLAEFAENKKNVLEKLTNMTPSVNKINDTVVTVTDHIFDSGKSNLSLKKQYADTEKKINDDMIEAGSVRQNIRHQEHLMPSADGMLSESDKLMIRESYKHMTWSILAILVVLGSIKLSN